MAELEQAVIVSFLLSAESNYHQLLHKSPPRVARWQVRCIEEYIEANWSKAITIEEIADISGASARSIFRAFREDRGYSPMVFAKKTRLENAKKLLQYNREDRSITEIAYLCGFTSPSRFTEEYKRYFGERPSETQPLNYK